MQTLHGLILREPIDSDWPALAALHNLDSDDQVTAAEYQRRYDAFPPEGRRIFKVLVGPEGDPIGVGRASRRPSNGPGAFYAEVTVDPSFRGQGYGAGLYQWVHEFLEAEQARVVTFFVRETDEVGLQFAQKRGYVMDRVLAESALDLGDVDLPIWESRLNPEIELLTIAELGDDERVWRMAHRVSVESDDAPDIELWGERTFEEFFAGTRHSEQYVPNGVVLARIIGEVAGIHTVGPLPKSEGWKTRYTGVLPAFRRRGVATALKVFGIRQALAGGAKWIMTYNDSSNEGMLAINRALGFQGRPGFAQMRKWVER